MANLVGTDFGDPRAKTGGAALGSNVAPTRAFANTPVPYPPVGNWPSNLGVPLADLPGVDPKYQSGIDYYQSDMARRIGYEATERELSQYSGILIPKSWSTTLNYKFHRTNVVEHLVNTRWEKEFLEMGNSVIIRKTGDAQIFAVSNSRQRIRYQEPESSQQELAVNKCIGVAFSDDDILEFQSDFNYMSEYFNDAAIRMANYIDRQVLTFMPGFSHPDNFGNKAGHVGDYDLGSEANPLRVNKDTILDLIVHMNTVLREQEIPDVGIWVVIPPAIHNLIMRSDLRDVSLTGERTTNLRGNSHIGRIAGFDIYESSALRPSANNVYKILFGHPTAVTFVSQVKQFEGPLKDVRNFMNHYRGRIVYDFDCTQPEALGHAIVQVQV